MLKKGHKRCKVSVYEVKNESEYEEQKLLGKKLLFEECYNTMKNYDEDLLTRQFFIISEMNWNGKKEVDRWKYYSNHSFIHEDDEQLCRSLLQKEQNDGIVWQG